jgi:chromosomal replication initiator protein
MEPQTRLIPVQSDARNLAARMRERLDKELVVFSGLVTRGALFKAVSAETGLLPREIKAHRRDPTSVLARFVFVYLARTHMRASFPQIGATLGGRDHTTILHAFRRAQDLRAADPAFAARCARIEARLWPRAPSTESPAP